MFYGRSLSYLPNHDLELGTHFQKLSTNPKSCHIFLAYAFIFFIENLFLMGENQDNVNYGYDTH